jgi:hypothetical protein
MTDLIESEDELLDPQPGPAAAAPPHRVLAALHRLRDRTPLGAAGHADPDRRRRLVLAGLLALAVAAGAGATGVIVHSRDLKDARTHTQERMLLHVLGGSATLTFGNLDGTDGADVLTLPSTFQTPLAADFTVALRNDSAKPLQVSAIQISVPGVDVVGTAPLTTLAPGDSEALTSRVAVHCTATDLPQYPSGVTVTVRTPATKAEAAGPATSVPLAFDAGHPAEPAPDDDPASADDSMGGLGEVGVATIGSFVTSSFYRLCGDVLTTMPPRVSATGWSGVPSRQNPVVHYSLHIDDSTNAAQVVLPLSKPPVVPGVSAQTDLTGPQQIGSEGLDVNVTDRITDCTAFGGYLALRGGAGEAADALNAATPVGLQPVDPRFRTTPTPLSSTAQSVFAGLTPGLADLQSTLLTQLATICPEL